MDSMKRHIIDLGRRGLLKGSLGAAALAALMGPPTRAWAQPAFRAYPFALGVASGDPLPDGVVIWTRLAPEPLAGGGMPRAAMMVGWQVASDEQFRTVVAQGEAVARPELGHAIHVEVGGLSPATRYFYRFRAGRELSPVGRTRTAPAADAPLERLTWVNAGCQHYEVGHFTAFRHLAEEELDFVFHYGDYIYEYRARGSSPGLQTVRQHNSEEIYTIDDYRNRYALYKSDPDLMAAHAAHPFLMSFDDHEVDNNHAGMTSEEDGSARFPIAVPDEIFALRKQIAFQVWYESMPVRRAQLPRGPEITAYRRLRYGNLATVNVLDTRTFRDDQPCGDITGPACAAVANPNAQILGAAQERWLLDGLGASRTTWNILAQQVMVMPRDLGTESPAISMDKWDAYPAARERLLARIQDANVRNVVVLTGDVHNAWAGTIRRNPADERSPAVASEFVATSITSGGDGNETNPGGRRALERNAHIAFYNNRRGYSVHTATPARMEVAHRVVPFVTRPGAPREDRDRFVVEAGVAGVQRG